MKKIPIILIITFFFNTLSLGQIQLGIRGGVNTLQIDKESSINPASQLASQISSLAVEQTKPGIAAGLLVQIRIWKLLLQPEVLFTQTRLDYNVLFTNPMGLQNTLSEIKSEESQYVDIPVLIQYKLGPVRLGVGPEAHIFLNSTSELLDFDNYGAKFKTATYSWVANVGFDYNKFLFDVRYEGNFSAIGDQFVIDGVSYEFDQTPGRWVFTAGIYF